LERKRVNASFNTNSIIFIYDRYGKLITKIIQSDGWDGTFNGNPLPSDDYWYTAKLQDGRETKGHFSLKDDDNIQIQHFNYFVTM
jgi:gliding motility-associated-like protein